MGNGDVHKLHGLLAAGSRLNKINIRDLKSHFAIISAVWMSTAYCVNLVYSEIFLSTPCCFETTDLPTSLLGP
jgi:hypothetical protein